MMNWLEWFEERAAQLMRDTNCSRGEAESAAADAAVRLLLESGERPPELIESSYRHLFYGIVNRAVTTVDVVVDEYRYRHFDHHWRTSHCYYTETEAADTFGSRPHERLDDTRRSARRARWLKGK